MVMRSLLTTVGVAVLALQPAPAEQRTASNRLAIGDLFSYQTFVKFNGNPLSSMDWVPEGGPWIDDTHYLWPENTGEAAWLKVEARSGNSAALIDSKALESALVAARGTPRGGS